jgi:hypothetical protein
MSESEKEETIPEEEGNTDTDVSDAFPKIRQNIWLSYTFDPLPAFIL